MDEEQDAAAAGCVGGVLRDNNNNNDTARPTSSYTGAMLLNSCCLVSDSCPGTKALRGPGICSYAAAADVLAVVGGGGAVPLPLLLAARARVRSSWCCCDGCRVVASGRCRLLLGMMVGCVWQLLDAERHLGEQEACICAVLMCV